MELMNSLIIYFDMIWSYYRSNEVLTGQICQRFLGGVVVECQACAEEVALEAQVPALFQTNQRCLFQH